MRCGARRSCNCRGRTRAPGKRPITPRASTRGGTPRPSSLPASKACKLPVPTGPLSITCYNLFLKLCLVQATVQCWRCTSTCSIPCRDKLVPDTCSHRAQHLLLIPSTATRVPVKERSAQLRATGAVRPQAAFASAPTDHAPADYRLVERLWAINLNAWLTQELTQAGKHACHVGIRPT